MKRFFRGLCAAILTLVMLVSTASALTVEQALALLEEGYLRDIPADAYEAGSLEELFSLLGDPYTYYMTEEEYQGFLDSVENTVNVVGIGVSIQYTNEGILVVDVLKGGSAEEAGLKPGDLIVEVDGVSCVPANESHQTLITGEEGTWVTIKVIRGGSVITYRLTRRPVVVHNTRFSLVDEHIGYIQCTSFGTETGTLLTEGVEAYNESVDSWLVDVRGNAGGYTQAAVEAVGVFAGAGAHLYLQDGLKDLYYYGYLAPRSTGYPVVVLVDGDTASAAEAFAAGVRDLGLGITIGSRTYGKGVAQIVYDAANCPDYFAGDAVKLTAYRFYSAGGITNDVVGVIPTLLVSDEAAPALAQALCGVPGADREDLLVFHVGGQMLMADLTKLNDDLIGELFEALPPDTYVWLHEEGVDYDVTLAEAVSALGVSYESRWFKDVTDSIFADQINTLATYDILHGDGEGNFYPGETLKRREVCAMLAKALNLSWSGRQIFADVPSDDPDAAYISAMAEMGFVQGRGNGTFCPDQTLTQEECFVILARVARYLNVDFDFAADSITQKELDEAAAQGFHSWSLSGAALLNMVGAIDFAVRELTPAAPILREEAAAGLYEVLTVSGILP